MAMQQQNLPHISPLLMKPGILRDGTTFAKPNYVDGQWMRFYRGLPKKMGGYQQITADLTGIARGVYVVPRSPNFDVYVGDANKLIVVPINYQGIPIGNVSTDRTPANFATNPANDWQFDVMYSNNFDSSILIAFAAPNLNSIDSRIERPVYYGKTYPLVDADVPLQSTGINVSGGIMVLHPFLFYLGNDGQVQWSEASNPSVIAGESRIAPYKLVAGLATRGGTNSPAGLIWSLDRVIRVTFVGGATQFNFDTVTGQSSILSSRSIIEWDGLYFWCGVDRFLFYNGAVQELPNDMNMNFFFNNLNYAQRQKVWATKVTRWGEIWWFFPKGDSIECNWAIVYNVRQQVWYDTPINRADGYYDNVFAQPIWSDTMPIVTQQLNGTPSASTGDASGVFTGVSPCTQSAPNGYIRYQWQAPGFPIAVVKITSETTQTYQLSLQSSNDGATWNTVLAIPSQTYTADTEYVFNVPVPDYGTYFQILETGGHTLNIQALNFSTNNYPIWMQEVGVDQVVDGKVSPIYSFFETGSLSWVAVDAEKERHGYDRWYYLYRVEPDFLQEGDMTLSVMGQQYSRVQSQNTNTLSGPYTFSPTTEKIDIGTPRQAREMTLKFESNTIGGDYEMGQILVLARIGDGRQSPPTEAT